MLQGNPEKRYVPVVVHFDTEGRLRPLEVEFDEEHKYAVERGAGRVPRRLPDSGGRGGALYCPDPRAREVFMA